MTMGITADTRLEGVPIGQIAASLMAAYPPRPLNERGEKTRAHHKKRRLRRIAELLETDYAA